MNNKNNYIIAIVLLGVVSIAILLFRNSYAVLLDNDIEVAKNSELIYYLNVSYDGVDKNGVESDDVATSFVKSGNIYVLDKIPDGLTFTGFVTSTDGSFGAVKRGSDVACTGSVVDDTNDDGVWNTGNTEYTYHGLHYNATTREVSFRVKSLGAGCVLTIGIKTQTPSSVDDPNTPVIDRRRDFYNFATGKEKDLLINSNTVHAYMGSVEELHQVQYAYTGDVPSGVPSPPEAQNYVANTKVGVASTVNIDGYLFNGWTSTDVDILNGSFTMPNSDVTLTGSFTAIDNRHKVTYVVNGTKPDNYVVPREKEYFKDAIVSVDGLENGDVIDGYKFLGWTTSSVSVLDNDFVMPEADVVFEGEFTDVTYDVTYAFYDTVLPPNSDSLLPAKQSYKPGQVVSLANMSDIAGYTFLGWYKENNFIMPSENVTIYGEWKRVLGNFEPSIVKTVYNDKGYYQPDEVITFKITVRNNDNFRLKDIFVKENNSSVSFVEGTGYEIVTNNYVKINELGANSSIDLFATYKVKQTDKGVINNEVEIVGALADNGYELKEKEYKATASTNIKSSIKICKLVSGINVGNTFQIKVSNNSYETWVVLAKDGCKIIYVNPGIYRINEIIPQEYVLSTVTGISANNSDLNVLQGHDYEVTFTNMFVKKGFLHSSGKVVNRIEGNNE